MRQVVGFGWTILALVFLDELLAVAAAGVYGWSASPRWLLVWLLPALTVLAWALFASPKARLGTKVGRPVVKVVVFGLASWGLWSAGHHGLAAGLLVFSLVVNALAATPQVRELTNEGTAARPVVPQ